MYFYILLKDKSQVRYHPFHKSGKQTGRRKHLYLKLIKMHTKYPKKNLDTLGGSTIVGTMDRKSLNLMIYGHITLKINSLIPISYPTIS